MPTRDPQPPQESHFSRRKGKRLAAALGFGMVMAGGGNFSDRTPKPELKNQSGRSEAPAAVRKSPPKMLEPITQPSGEVQAHIESEASREQHILTALNERFPKRGPFQIQDMTLNGRTTHGTGITFDDVHFKFMYRHDTGEIITEDLDEVVAPNPEPQPVEPMAETAKPFSPLESETFFDSESGEYIPVDVEGFLRFHHEFPREVADVFDDIIKNVGNRWLIQNHRLRFQGPYESYINIGMQSLIADHIIFPSFAVEFGDFQLAGTSVRGSPELTIFFTNKEDPSQNVSGRILTASDPDYPKFMDLLRANVDEILRRGPTSYSVR